MIKKISVFVKGGRNSSSYYRFYEYFDHIEGAVVKYHIMYPRWVEEKYSPVGSQNIIMKVIIYIVAYMRMLYSLICDSIEIPHTVVVSRRIINRYMPLHFKWMLSYILKRESFLVWDFDDHILKGKELTKSDFDFFSRKADVILVTHHFLKDLVEERYHSKTFIMPTTDGDMFKNASNPDIYKDRIKTFDDGINLVWVAYSVNLQHLQTIIPALDRAAKNLNKPLTLNVVCDKPLVVKTDSLIINNIKWTKEDAIQSMMRAHIGIMPLKPSEYSNGKGGFKLVQYISIGLPCIASNVGFNKVVIGDDECGLLVDDVEGWSDAILKFNNIEVWKNLSSKAYSRWERYFSYEKNLSDWKSIALYHQCPSTLRR